ncbi:MULTISPECIES: hypothetical protein [unclassified Lysobacter]|uniref:hypothetical protein n=1 Tax=unclassified Lysobacter TaxID=2635362 RepID=UPI000B11E9F8|nr:MULTISPECIES: hypothetical protein [unclassified Lysobacter]
MRPRIVLATALLALFGQPATASQTACRFTGGESPQYYEVEFIGYTDIDPMVVFSSTTLGSGDLITLSSKQYTLKQFSQKTATVDLTFRNPGDDSLPPSFTLIGQKGKAQLKISTRTIDGSLRCDF